VRRLAPILLLVAAVAAASAAAAPNTANQARIDSTVRFLQEAQNADGGFGGAKGARSGSGFSAWVALALAAASVNPQDQARRGGVDVHTYLATHFWQGVEESDCAPVPCTTTYERELMVANASGTAPRDFGGVDLLAGLLARARPDGSFPHVPGGQPGVNDTIFAIFALAPIGELATETAIQRAADWVEAAQHDNGGWAWRFGGGAPDEVDMTGAAIQALVAAGRGRNAVVESGIEYLRGAQNPDGGFPTVPGGGESNVASTAWATQAVWAVGENPEDWLTRSGGQTEEPLEFMESLQQSDGHIRWKASQDLNGLWMTAYAVPAFAGQTWPIPAPPRTMRPERPPQGAGQGSGSRSGDGVLAGGGGNGAPLFSRPKPQSRGSTPGGARVLGGDELEAVNRSRTRRGENALQPRGTATAEASSAPAEPSVVAGSNDGSGGGGGSTGRGEVSGLVIGSAGAGEPGRLAPGAPGLHGAGPGEEGEWSVAIGIGAAALLVAFGGAGWERRRQEAVL
jgi:prenyltransferase beta subunit